MKGVISKARREKRKAKKLENLERAKRVAAWFGMTKKYAHIKTGINPVVGPAIEKLDEESLPLIDREIIPNWRETIRKNLNEHDDKRFDFKL